MKKKLITLTVVFALLLSVFPVNIFAEDTQPEKKYDLEKPHQKNKLNFSIKKPTKSQIKAVGSELEYYKQEFLEIVDSYYYDFDPNATYEGFMKECYESYLDITNYINNATTIDNLIPEETDLWGSVSDSFYEKLMIMLEFSKLSNVYDENKTYIENFKSFKINSQKQQKMIFDCLEEDSFNEYYQSMITGAKITTYQDIKNAENYKQLASAKANLISFIANNINEGFDLDYSGITEDYCSSEFYQYYVGDNYIYYNTDVFNVLDVFPITKYNFSEKVIYNKEEANVIKKTYNRYLYVYVKRQLTKEGLYNEEVENIYNSTINKINKSISVEEAVYYCLQAINQIEEITGSTYKDISDRKRNEISTKIGELDEKYTKEENLYSEDNYMIITDTIFVIEEFVNFYNIKDAELPADLIGNLTAYLDKIPTKEEELKMAKERYIKYLNNFRNNVKYNQAKVVPIINEGIKLINNATTIEKARSIYITYYNKAKATIKKFNIKTSKVGNGYITSSKVAKYGSSVSISIKPKTGYKIGKIYVDGKRVKITTKYTFKNITKNHTIKAVFVKK